VSLWTFLAAGMAAVVVMGPPGERDVFSRPVAGEVAGRPRLVLLASRETRSALDVTVPQLAARLADRPFVTVVRVDLRGVPGLFHRVAYARLRDSHARYADRARAQYAAHGLPPPADLERRLVLVGDAEGGSHAAAGLAEGFTSPLAVVEDAAGREVARGYLPQDLGRIEQALRMLVGEPGR